MPFYSRKPTRIPGYNYATQNYYFITICTYQKKCIFGTTDRLNMLGKISQEHMLKIESIFSGTKVDKFIVMPNHVHAIVILGTDDRKPLPNISTIIGQYKAVVTKSIRNIYPGMIVWQRSFHDHIIRNQRGYEQIWEYIENNPKKWKEDCFYQDQQ